MYMTEKTILKDLQDLGFTKNLAKVYLALFELGEGKAGEIVKKTGMHRHLVYTALSELEQKKLISRTVEQGIMRFYPLNPDFLLSEVRKKEELASVVIDKLKWRRDWTHQQVIVYETREEIAKVEYRLHDMMQSGETQYYLGLSSGWYELFDSETIEKIANLQKKRGFFIKGIGHSMIPDEFRYQQLTAPLTEWRYLSGVGSRDTEVTILKDRIFIKIFVAPYTGIEIINERLASDYRKYFETLWNQQTRSLFGSVGAREFLEETLQEKDVYWIGGNGAIEHYHNDVWQWYKEERIAQQVYWHDLVDPEMMLSGVIDTTSIANDPYYESKVLPPSVASPHVICIYGNKVANIVWKENSVITITEDIDVAAGYKKYFDYLWNQKVHTYTGWDELEALYFSELLNDINTGDVEYVIGANIGDTPTGQLRSMDFFTRFNTARKARGGNMQALVYQRDLPHIYQQCIDSGDIAAGTAQVKSLQDKYWSPLVVDIFSNKVVILMMKEEPTATVYTDVDIIAGFKKQFDAHWEQEVQTYVGWDAIEHLLLHELIPGMGPDDIEYAQGAGYDMTDDKERFASFWLSYNTKRVQRGMKRRLMMYEPYRELVENEMSLAGDESRTITEMRYLPKEYNSPMETHIYNNKVALIVWQGTPVATVYNRPEMAVSMRNQFEMLWNIASK
jgi:sugar-specific transcriptional regulator TrmB